MSPFVFRIKDLEQRPQSVDIELAPDFFSTTMAADESLTIDAGRCAGTLSGKLIFQSGRVFLRGTLKGQLGLSCDHCLEPALVMVDLPLNMTFAPKGPVPVEEAALPEDPFDPDDLDYGHYEGDILDLRETVRESFFLALPLSILCREDCAGLCPKCGLNKNDQIKNPCTCAQEGRPSAFAVLKDFKL